MPSGCPALYRAVTLPQTMDEYRRRGASQSLQCPWGGCPITRHPGHSSQTSSVCIINALWPRWARIPVCLVSEITGDSCIFLGEEFTRSTSIEYNRLLLSARWVIGEYKKMHETAGQLYRTKAQWLLQFDNQNYTGTLTT